jgi:hypothetical protein
MRRIERDRKKTDERNKIKKIKKTHNKHEERNQPFALQPYNGVRRTDR